MTVRFAIISGGQMGADRAALDWALQHDNPHGGWCPKGRLAADGPLDVRYQLKETPLEDLLQRTEWNVRDSDASVVLTLRPKATGAAQKTLTYSKKHRRPVLHLHSGVLAAASKLATFVQDHRIRRLNIAGSVESDEPGIYAWAMSILDKTRDILDRADLG